MHNKTDPMELLSGYQFHALNGLPLKRARAQTWAEQAGLKGTVLLAEEGVNFSLCGAAEQLNEWLLWLRDFLDCEDPIINRQRVQQPPFSRLKVRIRPEIVTFDRPSTSTDTASAPPEPLQPGVSVAPEDWNALIERSDVQLVDTRNQYEYRLGSFEGAQDPQTQNFTDFQQWAKASLDRKKPVAMFCTGGIRCEKASHWLKREGFDSVYQLKGGILSYLESVTEADSKWHGECFVFDDRVALDHQLEPTDREICLVCRMPIESADKTESAASEWRTKDSRDLCQSCARDMQRAESSGLREKVRQIRLAELRAGAQTRAGADIGPGEC